MDLESHRVKDFTLEEWPTDANRVRMVFSDGSVSRWFSRLIHTGDDGVLCIPDDLIDLTLV